MAQPFGHGLHVNADGQQLRRAGMSQIVEPRSRQCSRCSTATTGPAWTPATIGLHDERVIVEPDRVRTVGHVRLLTGCDIHDEYIRLELPERDPCSVRGPARTHDDAPARRIPVRPGGHRADDLPDFEIGPGCPGTEEATNS